MAETVGDSLRTGSMQPRGPNQRHDLAASMGCPQYTARAFVGRGRVGTGMDWGYQGQWQGRPTKAAVFAVPMRFHTKHPLHAACPRAMPGQLAMPLGPRVLGWRRYTISVLHAPT